MSRKVFSAILLNSWVLLSLALTPTWGDYIIHFTDGGRVTVHRYVEEGQSIKIYTPQGTISFRKDTIARISEVDSSQSLSTPLETLSAVSGPTAQVSTPGPLDSQNTTDSDKTPKPEGGHTTETTDASTTPTERLESGYQEVEQEFNKLWEKHLQDVDSGASEEVLTENRNRLSQLSNERDKLIKDARRAVPDSLPTWAR